MTPGDTGRRPEQTEPDEVEADRTRGRGGSMGLRYERVLVTGAAGRLGSAVLTALHRAEVEVVALDLRAPGAPRPGP
ncbi:hypothetical protein GCM10025864_14240 [Luteimicrobium album]|uniref:NAD-dependent epimerase/dehydratase domain-containing protein n=1 Tax=Luteimicrobium album TaxID=1054550 RepID=A0ABQ6HYU4_9MICO|nr:hypothetical protein GCM10025864_14240 [Luteimicrobium album]